MQIAHRLNTKLNGTCESESDFDKGTYLEVLVEIEGYQYCVMDELTLDIDRMPKPGEAFEFEFSNMIDEEERILGVDFSGKSRKKEMP